jgi:hypothetical protein
VAERETKLDDGTTSRLTKEQVEGFNQLVTLDERLAAMRATPEIGRQFMSTIEINETRSGIRALVLGGEAVQELDARASALVTPLAQATEEFQNLTAVIAENTQLTKARNEAEAASAVATIENRQRGFEGQILEIMDNALGRVNLSGLDAVRMAEMQAVMASGEAAGMTVADAASLALTRAQQKQQVPISVAGSIKMIDFGGQVSQSDIAILQRAIQQIQQLEQQRLQAAANQQPAPVRVVVQPPAARPKEAPLPAVTTP